MKNQFRISRFQDFKYTDPLTPTSTLEDMGFTGDAITD